MAMSRDEIASSVEDLDQSIDGVQELIVDMDRDREELYKFLIGDIKDDVRTQYCGIIYKIPMEIRNQLQFKLQLLADQDTSQFAQIVNIYKKYSEARKLVDAYSRFNYDEEFRKLLGDIFYTRTDPRQFHYEDNSSYHQYIKKIELCEIYLNVLKYLIKCACKNSECQSFPVEEINKLKLILKTQDIEFDDWLYDLLRGQKSREESLEPNLALDIEKNFYETMLCAITYHDDPSMQAKLKRQCVLFRENINLKRNNFFEQKRKKLQIFYTLCGNDIYEQLISSENQQKHDELFNIFQKYNAVSRALEYNTKVKYDNILRKIFDQLIQCDSESDDYRNKIEQCEIYITVVHFNYQNKLQPLASEFLEKLKSYFATKGIQFQDWLYDLLKKRTLNDTERSISIKFRQKLLNLFEMTLDNREISQVDINTFQNNIQTELNKWEQDHNTRRQQILSRENSNDQIEQISASSSIVSATQFSGSLFTPKTSTSLLALAGTGIVATGVTLAIGALLGTAILSLPVSLILIGICTVIGLVGLGIKYCNSGESSCFSACTMNR